MNGVVTIGSGVLARVGTSDSRDFGLSLGVPTVAGTSDAHGDHPIHGASNCDTHSYKEDRVVEMKKE